MNIIGCLDTPTTCQYRFNGQDVAHLDRDGLAQLRRAAFGFVFQSYNLLPGVNARENVEMPAIYSAFSAAERRAWAEQLLSDLGLAERRNHKPDRLSGGHGRGVSIAAARL